MRKRSHRPTLELLETRDCPTLTFSYTSDALGNWTVNAVPQDYSDNFLLLSETAPNTFDLQEFSDASETTLVYDSGNFTVLGNISIYLPNTNDTLNLALNGNSTPGSLYVDGGAGYNTVQQDPSDIGGAISGNVSLSRINNVNFFQGYAIGGNLSVSAAATNLNPNSLQLVNTAVGGNVIDNAALPPLNSLNLLTFSGVSVGGSLAVNLASITSPGDQTSAFVTLSNSTIETNFNYTGGGGQDNLLLDGMGIGGSVYMNLGNGTNQLQLVNSTVIDHNITVIGGINDDDINNFAATIGGSVNLMLGDGNNNVNLDGATILGSSVRITTGAGADTVTYNSSAPSAYLQVALGAGDDSFTFGPAAKWHYAYIDGGPGHNTFTNLMTSLPPSYRLTGF